MSRSMRTAAAVAGRHTSILFSLLSPLASVTRSSSALPLPPPRRTLKQSTARGGARPRRRHQLPAHAEETLRQQQQLQQQQQEQEQEQQRRRLSWEHWQQQQQQQQKGQWEREQCGDWREQWQQRQRQREQQREQQQQQQQRRRREFRKGPWIVGGVLVYAAGAYGAYAYRAYVRAADESRRLDGAVPHDVSARYDATAGSFDRDVALAEWLMGMGRLRRKLVREAMAAPAAAPLSSSSSSSSSTSSWWSSLISSTAGAKEKEEEGSLEGQAGLELLEVSVGTGRNARYYDVGRCKRITFVDKSAPMLEQAREQFFRHHPHYRNAVFVQQDASVPIAAAPAPAPAPAPATKSVSAEEKASSSSSSSSSKASVESAEAAEAAPPAAGYDAIVQTMGLCSAARPAELLRNLGRMAHARHGRILLLEHGRSHYAWLNRVLDALASAHALRHGCWWNRDIGRLVADSGLEVVRVRRYHLGTTWWLELRPCARRADAQGRSQGAQEGAQEGPQEGLQEGRGEDLGEEGGGGGEKVGDGKSDERGERRGEKG